MSRRAGVVAAACLVAGLGVLAEARAAEPSPYPGCGPVGVAGGEWPSYGHDLANTRHQDREKLIGATTVGDLELAWSYRADGAVFNNTPIVAGGCLYLASADGVVTARHADTGDEVWRTALDTSPPAFGGGLVATPAVDAERLFVIVNRLGSPYLQALDRATGAPVWELTLDDQPNAMSNSSPVAFAGMVFAGFSGDAGPGESERGGYVIADAATGAVAAKHYVIDDVSFAEGYAGAGVWSTPAVDVASGYAYVGTSNPHSPELEYERANSILKIDVDPARATFGQVVDHYKGKPDTYVDGLSDQPACETAPDVYYVDRFSLTCLAIDLDFGASPTLFSVDGRQLVGDLQKAGVFHAVDPESMDGVWEQVVGVPCLACNAASPASVGGVVYTAAGPPGQLFRLAGADGRPGWVGTLTGPTTYNPVTVANNVVYTVDGGGFLNGFVAPNGLHVLKRNLSFDAGESVATATSSSGVAVARNTLYVAAANHLFAFRLGGGGGGVAPPEPPPPPAAGGDAQIVAGPGAVATTYATPRVTVPRGGSVTFTNLDVPQHDVVSPQNLFGSPLIGPGQSAPVEGVEGLDAGSYPFYCSLHPNMTGTLDVTG